jgi:hypothetical protein
MQLLYSQPHSNIFHGHFFFEETSSKRAGSSYNPLKKKRIDPVYREPGPKNLTTARFINGLLGGKPAKKKLGTMAQTANSWRLTSPWVGQARCNLLSTATT